jgi:hypothetical protein
MKVKDILSDESRWTQGAAARNKRGELCSVLSPDATRFCILGAMARVYRSKHAMRECERRVADAIAAFGGRITYAIEIGDWNDDPGRTFDDVRQVIEKADV